MITRHKLLLGGLAALLARARAFGQAATAPHPAHGVLVSRLESDNPAADAGKYLQCTAAGGVAPVPGVPFPVWVYNVSLVPATGGLAITRDPATGVLTLPSAPQPPEALDLYINGLVQTIGPGCDCTVNGTQVIPKPDFVSGGKQISKRAEFLAATMIRASYPR